MASTETQTIIIKNNKGDTSEGVLHLETYDKQDRIKRAAIAWVGFWLLAAMFIPVLIVHFVAIPLFLILGPVFAYKRYNTESIPKEISGKCPTCGEDVQIKLEASDRLPMWSYCSPHNDPVQLLEST